MILATHGIIGSSIVRFDPNAFVFSIKTDNAGVSTSTQFRMPLTTSTGLNFDVDWGDGSAIENITNHTLAIHTYPSAGTYIISVTGSILGWAFNSSGDRLKMLNVFQWKGLNISTGGGFWNCVNLTCSATDAPTITSTSLTRYFSLCGQFNGDISNWDVSSVTNMSYMFLMFGGLFNRNIGAWNVSNVLDFTQMFEFSNFNNGGSDSIKNWVVSKGTNFTAMFGSCAFNQPIQSWALNTTADVSLRLMFTNNTVFNQPIGAWNTSRVISMAGVLYNNLSFDQDLSNWDINQVTVFDDSVSRTFFGNGTLSTANYDALLISWEAQAPLLNKSIDFGNSKYTAGGAAEAARLSLINTYNWTISDGGSL